MAVQSSQQPLNQYIEPYIVKIRLETVSFEPTVMQRIYRIFKRCIDIVLSFIAILLALPFLLIISILVRMDSKGPVIFKQKRVGQNRRPFTIYKFRTMQIDAPSALSTADFKSADQHITKIGSLLRKTSFDEIPQLFNILKGDMSIIGYRPLIPNEVEIDHFRSNNEIYFLKPGITGWSQINGRDDLSLTHKMLLDREYLHQFSFWMDVKIFFKTFIVIFKKEGVAF